MIKNAQQEYNWNEDVIYHKIIHLYSIYVEEEDKFSSEPLQIQH